MRERLRKAEDLLAAAEAALIAALLAVMVFLAFGQVVLRHFGAGLLWAETVLKHSVLWTGFLGAALAARAEKHFAWEAAHAGASERLKPWLRLVSSAASAVVTVFLLKAAWVYCAAEREQGSALLTLGAFAIPAWFASAGIPGGFALMLTHFLFKTADAAAEAAGQ